MIKLSYRNADSAVIGAEHGLNITEEFNNYQEKIASIITSLNQRKDKPGQWLQWMNLGYNEETVWYVKEFASMVRNRFENILVLGIGGSALGGLAVTNALLQPYWNLLSKKQRDNYPKIFFLDNIDPDTINGLLQVLELKKTLINVITKSGDTAETMSQFMVLRDLMQKELGDDYRKHIVATTDKKMGILRQLADQEGYKTFFVPDDVGGRFSVLTAVGLLPIACAGINIDELMVGAKAAMNKFADFDLSVNDAVRYAVIRNILLGKGKNTEILVGYEPYMLMLNEWWKQLYGESEGKDKKGIFPASVVFSTDLHSMGQYIQDGQRNLFETVISIADPGAQFEIPNDPANVDGLNFIAGRQLDSVNKAAQTATIVAHNDGGVPNLLLEVSDRTPASLGYLMYFFEFACGVSGYILGVNPFNQPGVEAYKKNMFALLGKPGYESEKAALEARLK